jgi:hypothetical protein
MTQACESSHVYISKYVRGWRSPESKPLLTKAVNGLFPHSSLPHLRLCLTRRRFDKRRPTADNVHIKAAGATIVTGALVTRLKSAKLFLGFDWLQSVNPKIDWRNFRVETEEGTEPLKMRTMEINSEKQEAHGRKEGQTLPKSGP